MPAFPNRVQQVLSFLPILLWLTVTPAVAQVERPSIDRLVAPYMKAGKVVGMTVSIVTKDGDHVFGYGALSSKGGAAPDDVHECIGAANFMKVHRVNRNTVDAGFGGSEAAEDRQ